MPIATGTQAVHPLKRLLRIYKQSRPQFLFASLCSVANKFFDVLPEVLIGVAVDVVVNKQQSFLAQLGIQDNMEQLIVLGILTVMIWAFESLFQYLYSIQWRGLAQSIEHDLRLQVFSRILHLEMKDLEETRTGNLLTLAGEDINQLERFLDNGANEIIQVFTTVILIGSVFLFVQPVVAAFAFLPIPFILFGAFWFRRRLSPLYIAVRDAAANISSQMENSIGGLLTVKSFTQEKTEALRIAQLSSTYQQANRNAIKWSSAFVPVIRMTILFGFTATLLYGGWLTIEDRLSVGSFSMLVFLTQRLLWPLTGLANTADLYERAMASLKRILHLIDKPLTSADGRYEGALKETDCSIEFKNVSFSYADGQPLFQDLSLTFAAGQTIGIVGATGSGKSTLAKLMLRFYDVQGGQITLAGRDLREYTARNLRSHVGYVNQDVFLFHGTIAENIAYGKPGQFSKAAATFEEIVSAAKQAEAHGFIETLPNGYNTIVGERGQKLSGGQRQRITLARALLKKPPILVFDEATSALDNETEVAIQKSLQEVSKNRTTILIAHRLSTLKHADKIFVFENGKVVEAGTHAELIQNSEGFYGRLWRVQS